PQCPIRDDHAEHDRDPGGAQVVINVVASDQTVYGNSSQPGYLEGYGVIDAEQVRALAAAASLRLADLRSTPDEASRYQPSAALERAIRCRDLTCRFRGCSRPAMACDIDHTIPFNHADRKAGGLTVWWNLKCLCRQHVRGMLFLFKGTPSTSPFCTWVNEPREPEALPPDWRPPPLQPLPDDPPF
ncbi:DUF222 domain-containing protein, partial [uncultured Mycobacterium sp.]|uniref:HNH endonuclease signature motif containing protein n=1 Tax=uncultured Mycobacterium sp. TaxID=171292 RepID=UPI0035C996F9